MARAIHSPVDADGSKPPAMDGAPDVAETKKRKRRSTSVDDEHASKQSRTDDEPMSSPPPQTAVRSSGDVPISPEYASKILAILEAANHHGLLERVVPLCTDPSSSSSTASSSLRRLLQNSPDHPLSTYKIAIHNLLPTASHSREPLASHHIQFCNLALSALEEASFHNVQFPLDRVSFITDNQDDDSELASTSQLSPQPPRKYALVQHLPQGDYWTSLGSSLALSSVNKSALATGHAELVAVFPSPYPSTSVVPTLGTYCKPPASLSSKGLPKQRKVTTGSFLDYGPWSSFAPTFDLENADIGRTELGQVFYDREMRKRAADEKRKYMLLDTAKRMDREDHPMDSLQASKPGPLSSIELEGILSPEDVESLKSLLHDADLLRSVEELLERNRKALLRLQELQAVRLNNGTSAESILQQGSEEWETAQSIHDSLTLLASLRPRNSDNKSLLAPSATALHALQRSLPLRETPGWHGSLTAPQTVGIRDNATIKVRAGATVTPGSTTPANVPVTPSPATTAPSFAAFNYNYNTSQTQFRTTSTPANSTTQTTFTASTYRPGSSAQYYPQYQAPNGQNNYYNSQAYNVPGQPSYGAYGAQWYQYGGNAGPTNSGRGTPQPTPTNTTQFNQYHHSGTTTPQNRPAAVANTVMASKQPQWGASPTSSIAYTPSVRAGQTGFQATR